jgi:DNA repair exonuclease SbcCD ATPase subunit
LTALASYLALIFVHKTMPAAIESIIKQRVIAQYLQGDSRDKIATNNDIGTGTVSNIIDEWKRAVQSSHYDSVRELAVHVQKEGVNLGDLVTSLRIKNYIKQLGEIDEAQVEQFVARCANSQEPQKLVGVLEKIGHTGLDVPVEELEEHIKQRQVEKDTLQHEIDEARAILDSVNVDRQIVEDYKILKDEMDKYHLQDPKKFLNVLGAIKKHKYTFTIVERWICARVRKPGSGFTHKPYTRLLLWIHKRDRVLTL